MNQVPDPQISTSSASEGGTSLRQWLDQIDGQRRSRDVPYFIGCSGHLLLNPQEEATASAMLTEEVLPELLRLSRGRRLVLMCGLAPGADLLFLRVAGRWLESRHIPYARVGLLPVPARMLEQDWSLRANREGYTVSERDRAQLLEQIQAAEAGCETRIDLAAGIDPERLATAAARQQQYRWLGAVLATRTDALLAVLRRGIRSQPGGTSEIVLWRRDPASMPEALRRGVAGAVVPSSAALFVIDPRPPTLVSGVDSDAGADPTSGWQPGDEALRVAQAARCALAEGNDLLCNDLVYRAFERGLNSPELAWLRVQSLANVGSTELALRQYQELAPPPEQRDAPWLTLLGRLQKERALDAGQGGAPALVEAAQSYLAALQRQPDSYPAINAATLLVLAGEREQGREWARQALQLLPDNASTDGDPVDRYFAHATAAEAYLILDCPQQAGDALARADALLPNDFWRRQVTLRQLQRLCHALDLDPDLLRGLKPPPLIVLRRAGGLIDVPPAGFELDAAELPAHATWFVSLGDVFDLCVIEALLARGQALYACLPYSANALIEYAHLHYGEHWGRRLETCLGRLRRVTVARGFLDSEREWAALEARDCAQGLATLAAQRGIGDCRAFDIVAQAGGATLKATASPEAGARGAAPAGRRMVGLIFADIAGFMRLDDPDLPAFWNGVMAGLGRLLDAHGDDVLLRQSWGDALHVVTASAAKAAEVAQQIQGLVTGLVDAGGSGLPRLELRVAVHYAPAFEGLDPIQHAPTYYGTQLTFTARIEPVTPPGQVYVTEALAARLAIEAPERFVCDYVGEIQLAKRFGDYRVYAMRPARSRAN